MEETIWLAIQYNIVEIRVVFQRNLIVQGPERSEDNTWRLLYTSRHKEKRLKLPLESITLPLTNKIGNSTKSVLLRAIFILSPMRRPIPFEQFRQHVSIFLKRVLSSQRYRSLSILHYLERGYSLRGSLWASDQPIEDLLRRSCPVRPDTGEHLLRHFLATFRRSNTETHQVWTLPRSLVCVLQWSYHVRDSAQLGIQAREASVLC
jgi:hypothetical protein